MVATASTMRALGTAAPDFSLRDVVSGNRVSLETFAGKDALLVMFISRHCPYVQHVKEELARIGKDYSARNVGIVGISSNDILTYPDDAPEKLKEMAQETGFTFPICHDETQEVAKAYTAACTPDIFLFDGSRKLAYRGQLDDHGKELQVTVVAIADELACAAELVMGKTARVPVVVIRGYTPEGRPGTGRDLVRPAELDLFR